MLLCFVNPFTSCVTNRYQLQQYIIMKTQTETDMNICMYKHIIVGMCNIFSLTLLTFCVMDDYGAPSVSK